MRITHLLLSVLLTVFLAACGQSEEASQATADKMPAADQATAEMANGAETADGIPTGQLPKTVIPQHYAVNLTMNPDETAFSGHTEIDVKIVEPVDTVWMHGKDLRVSQATLKLANGETLPLTYEQVKDFGVVKLGLPETVEPQAATLVFDYTADFSKGLLGPYRVQEDGEWYVFTQFEPTAARMAFPSFDEPAFKTPFDLTIIAPENDKVVANTPQIDSKKLDNGMVKHVFATTKPLPTYLLAYAAGPLDIVEYAPIPATDVRDHPVPLRGITVKGKGEQMQYALENAAGIVIALENYFQIPYPYQKLDLIAVPDFGAGAMENAGAITFREVLLLIPDPENAPSWQLEAYAGVMAHELAHQWFGNLVTMPWWNDIWLNEAFATWMAAKAVESWDPSMPVKQDIASRISRAMGADSLATARQIRQPIKSHHDIHNAFDGITYSKGGSVLLMFEQYLGEETFREGVQYHLNRFAYGNADVFDFLESLSHAAGYDIAPAFKTFLFQAGIPLIEFDVNCGEGNPTVTMIQSRYVPLGSTANTDQQWKVPVCMNYAVNGETHKQCNMLAEKQATFELEASSCPAWLMPNAGGIGYYHWTFEDAQGYDKLMGSLDKLGLLEQLSLERSIKAGFNAGKLTVPETLSALAPLVDSEYYEVAEAPMGIVIFADDRLTGEDLQAEVSAYARSLYADYEVADDFTPGNAPKDTVERKHHVRVASFLANTGNSKAVREAATKAGHALVGFGTDGNFHPEAVTPDFMGLALSIAVEESGADFYNHLVDMLHKTKIPLVKRTILSVLGGATEPELVAKTQEMILSGKLKQNEVPTLMFSYLSQEENRAEGWQWFKKNYQSILGVMARDQAAFLPSVGGLFCSTEKAQEVEAFFNGKVDELPGAPRVLAQTLERMSLCIAAKKAQAASAKRFFQQVDTAQ